MTFGSAFLFFEMDLMKGTYGRYWNFYLVTLERKTSQERKQRNVRLLLGLVIREKLGSLWNKGSYSCERAVCKERLRFRNVNWL